MPPVKYTAVAFIPTASRASNESAYAAIYRATNLFIRSRQGQNYAEVYSGSLSLGETIPAVALTGTIATNITTRTITGTGTSFMSELHLGQRLITLTGEIVVVSEIVSDTSFTAHNYPLASASGLVAYRTPILFEIDKKRGTLLSGNALEFDQGTILCVGSGTLRVNGATLSASLTATKKAQIAIYQQATNDYLIQQLGFALQPYGITATAGAAPATKTFTDADVNTGTDTITIVAHGYVTGQKVNFSQAATLPAPLQPNTAYFLIVTGANTFKVATSLQNANAGTAIDITTTGTAGTNTVTPVSKNMPAGDRSIRIAKASTKLNVPNYGNPGEKIKVTLTAGQSIQISLTAMDSNTNPNNPHDAWRIYASEFGGTTTSATANADSGPWYLVRTVTAAELGTTGAATYNLEYLDAEIQGTLRLISFDNDAPVDAEYLGTVAGYPVLVSCQGKATAVSPNGSSPGPCLVPFKPQNLAAAPLVLDTNRRNDVPLSPPEQIVGSYMAAGRLYLMTANTLQIAVFTQDNDFPVATRPFWKAGFKNPYAVCFVNGDLYGFAGNRPTRSTADESQTAGSEDHKFAFDVQELMQTWRPENVFVVEDPKNECVCYINSSRKKNAAGFWESEIIPFFPGSGKWSMPIVFSSNTQDRVITGAATVNGRMEFLMGGRDGSTGIEIKTYRFDEISGETVPYSAVWQLSDAGVADRPKKLKKLSVQGKLTSATAGIFAAAVDEVVSIANIEAGNASSKTGAIPLYTSTGVEYGPREDVMLNGQATFTVGVEGVWNGSGDLDRIDSVHLDVLARGRRM